MYYSFVDADTSWETNITDDAFKMQAPFKVEVNMQFHLITDYLPQKRGRMYTLAKEFDSAGQPQDGSKSDWLADSIRTGKEVQDLLAADPNLDIDNNQREDEIKEIFKGYGTDHSSLISSTLDINKKLDESISGQIGL